MPDDKQPTGSNNFLLRGSEYVTKSHPDFKLVGRDEELKKLTGILMRKSANNVLLIGAGGSGCSALCMGLQASKDQPGTPLDLVNKRFYWLDTDAMFASGNTAEINESFKKIIRTLTDEPNTVLVVEDTKDFTEAARNNGCTNLVNSMMSEIKKGKFQAIFQARESDLESILKVHSDVIDDFTPMELAEPSDENLQLIVNARAASLEKFHGIKISPEAIAVAIDVTSKYRTRDASLSRAQPERALTLIDRAFTAYRQKAHARPIQLDALEARLAAAGNALDNKVFTPELEGRTPKELEAIKLATASDIDGIKKAWEVTQKSLADIYKQQRNAEDTIRSLQADLAKEAQEQADRLKKNEEQATAEAANPAPPVVEEKKKSGRIDMSFFKQANAAGLTTSGDGGKTQDKIDRLKKETEANTAKYDQIMAGINAPLQLASDQVLTEFSVLSGIPVNKLTQNETEKLLKLRDTLSNRVFDQDEAVTKLSAAIKVAKTGLKEPNEPDAAFLFLGPSGVGKTELALAVTQALYDDDKYILRFDMSEFSEKNAVAKLIGAPPGYEGFEQGGRLTTAVRKNPRSVVLFDEIEKGDDSIYDILLQVLSAARLTDNHGLTSDFTQTVVVMTSNIGSQYFLDPTLTYDQAKAKAMEDLQKRYRPEFLNRFAGKRNIICFQKLQNSTIERIAGRELDRLNGQLGSKGLKLDMDKPTIKDVVAANYQPETGARGIAGYFKTDIKPIIADTILSTPNAKGVMKATFDTVAKAMHIAPPVLPASNQNMKPVPAPAAALNPR